MEPAHQAIGQGFWQQLAGTQIFREAGVIRGREIELVTQTIATRCQAHRTFSCDMNTVWRKRVQCGGNLGIGLVGKPNFRIGRTSKRTKVTRCQHQYFVTFVAQTLLGCTQGVDDAIDLRLTRVTYDGNAHKSSTPANFEAFFNCMISPQVTSRSSPEGSSISADKLSTQSPSLQ